MRRACLWGLLLPAAALAAAEEACAASGPAAPADAGEQQGDCVAALQVLTNRSREALAAPQGYAGAGGAAAEAEGKVWEYIVVGAGSAGSPLAGRLAEAGKSVLLIERGPDDDWTAPDAKGVIDPQTPAHWSRMLGHPDLDPGYSSTGEGAARCEMVGGCSMHNLMVWLRGAPEMYDLWGGSQWSSKCILSKFMAMEDSSEMSNGDPKYHNTSGPVKISPPIDPVDTHFKEWALANGHKWNPDMNGASQLGVGPYPQNTFKGKRFSLSKAFITPTVRALPNFKLLTHTIVTKVLFEGKKAVGVAYEEKKPGGPVTTRGTIKVSGEVILSGGAYRSPQILMLSGVGPASVLKKFGIPVVAVVEGVGQNLQDHPRSVVVENNPWSMWAPQNPASSFIGHGAVLTSAYCKAHPEVPECGYGDLQFMVSDAGQVNGLIATSFSRGHVTLHSTSPYEIPEVHNNWFSDPRDRSRMEEMWRMGQSIQGKNPNAKVPPLYMAYDMGHWWKETVKNFTQLADYALGRAVPVFSMWHPAGTCKMGPTSDQLAVVDHELRVRGVTNLRVADASIMPIISNTNPNAPCAVIGYNLADILLGKTCKALR